MPICENPKCKRKFHACSSCGLNYDWEWKWCCEKCRDDTDEWQYNITELKNFVAGLSTEQNISLYRILFDFGDGDHFLSNEVESRLKRDQSNEK